MGKEQETLSVKLQGMLRCWGAAEAAKTVPVGESPARRRSIARGVAWRRWALPAVVAVFLLAAAGVFVAWWLGGQKDAELRMLLEVDQKTMEDKVAKLQGDVRTGLVAQNDLEKQLQAAREEYASLENEYEALQQKPSSVVQAKELTKLQDQLRQANAALENIRRVSADGDAKLAQLRAAARDAEDKVKLADARVASASGELRRSRKIYQQTLAKARNSENELAMMKVQRAGMMEYFLQAYVAMVIGRDDDQKLADVSSETPSAGTVSLRVRQELIRRSRLIQRCARIRGTAKDESTRKLLERLEMVLTRMELLDSQDFTAMQAFSSLLRGNGVRAEIDKALGGVAEKPAVRAWLFEALLILTGADRVG